MIKRLNNYNETIMTERRATLGSDEFIRIYSNFEILNCKENCQIWSNSNIMNKFDQIRPFVRKILP